MNFDLIRELLPEAVIYITLIVMVFAFVGKQLAEASESFARILGPLGRMWRKKIDEEKKVRLEQFKAEARLAVDSELGVARKAEYASLKKQLIEVLDRVQDLERNENIYEAYMVADGAWHREVNIRLAETGALKAPLPDRVAFYEFDEQYRKQRGWELPRR